MLTSLRKKMEKNSLFTLFKNCRYVSIHTYTYKSDSLSKYVCVDINTPFLTALTSMTQLLTIS